MNPHTASPPAHPPQVITGGAPFTACGQTYHRACFKCTHCGDLIGPEDEWHTHENKPYCQADYEAKFCERCAECHESIIGGFVR
jgi:hypothetical protein